MIPERSRKPARLALTLTLASVSLIALNACNAVGGKAANKASDRRAMELGLSSDALDPTVRDKRDGYGRWKQKPDPEGSVSPLSPERRPWAEQP